MFIEVAEGTRQRETANRNRESNPCPYRKKLGSEVMTAIVKFVLIAAWVSGLVLANGFWSTLLALFIPMWAWYLVAERLIVMFL
jgi:hypothetical protein